MPYLPSPHPLYFFLLDQFYPTFYISAGAYTSTMTAIDHAEKKDLHTMLDKLYKHDIVENLRHYYLLLQWKDIDTPQQLFDELEKLRVNHIVKKKVDVGSNTVTYIPTPQARETTTAMINESQMQRGLLYRCLYRYTYSHVEGRIPRMIEVADDFQQNYDLNIFKTLRTQAEDLDFLRLNDRDVLDSLIEMYEDKRGR